MKKIMFNDRYGLTQAVLEGRKTMTRRIINGDLKKITAFPTPYGFFFDGETKDGFAIEVLPKYCKGEKVAVAQSYKDINLTFIQHQDAPDYKKMSRHCRQWGNAKAMAGWTNKMFVCADHMPHRIRITDIKVERLQDISEDDVYKEGFSKESVNNGWGNAAWHWEAMLIYYDGLGRTREIRSRKPKEAFSFLIDHINGNGTWERNPWVFAYEFELIKIVD